MSESNVVVSPTDPNGFGSKPHSVYENEQEAWFQSNPAARVLAQMPSAPPYLKDEEPVRKLVAIRDPDYEPIRLEWKAYLAAVDVNDGRTPRERLQEYFK